MGDASSCGLVFLVDATSHNLESRIGQWSLQFPCFIQRGAHSDVAFFLCR
jgi:hypothetical protein